MARYKVKAKSFIDDRLVEEGTEIEYAGEPGENLEPLDDAANAAVAAAAARRAAKADAIKSALAGTIDPKTAENVQTLIGEVQAFASRLAAIEARIAQVEGAARPDLTPYALRTDVSELDAGLTLISGRVAEVEGTLAALAVKVQSPPPPPPADTPSA